jgi:vitamin B12 transporter
MDVLKKNRVSDRLCVFRQWSRKKYAIFFTLGKQIKIGVLCLAYSLTNRMPVIKAQPDTTNSNLRITEIQQIEITGHKNQAAFSEVSRITTVIRGEDIEKAGIQSFQDLLEYLSNIDVRQRGLFGVQSDISIRGGSFDHVMILVNGINLSDPQTGHASLDLPFDKECIERIEVLEGSAARILGSGAFTGAINIVTKRGNEDQVSLNQLFGMHGLIRTHMNASVKMNKVQQFISAGFSTSKGYIEDTDFNIKNACYIVNYAQDNAQINIQAGFQDKKFGAAGFYSPRFPNQYEETGLWFASVHASVGDKVRISPLVYMRHRKDHFLLDRDDPEFYQNFHLTNIIGSQINLAWHTGPVHNTVGFDMRSENILSNNLGFDNMNPIPVLGEDSIFYTKRYGRDNFAYFQEHNYQNGNFDISGGIMLNWNSAYPDKPSLFPGLDASYRFWSGTRIYFSFNRGLNLPTFTDLFYTDPVNQGNILLKPNRLVSLEAGFKQEGKNVRASLAFFMNRGQDIIDWLWSYDQHRFSPVNLLQYRVNGFESSMVYRFSGRLQDWTPLHTIALNYIFMDIRKSVSDSVSKYYNLKHKVSLMIRHGVAKKIEVVWTISYQDRMGEMVLYNNSENSYFFSPYRPYWLLDGSVNWTLGPVVLYADLTNILNTTYIDAGSVEQPGRWFKAGFSLNLAKRKNP